MCPAKNKAALVLFLLLSSINFLFGEGRLERAIHLFNGGQYAEAEELLHKWHKENPREDQGTFYLGRISYEKRDLPKAIEWFEKAIELRQDTTDYYYWLAISCGEQVQYAGLLKKGGLASKAKKAALKALELDENNLDAHLFLMRYYLYAPGLFGGSKEKASNQAKEIIDRDFKRGREAFAEIHYAMEFYDTCEKEYLALICDYPDDPEYRIRLGCFYQQIKDYDKSFQYFEASIEKHPQQLMAYYEYGRSAIYSGNNIDKGIASYKRYISHPYERGLPSHASAYWRMGMLYELKDDKIMAKECYETALNREPNHRQAKKALDALEF